MVATHFKNTRSKAFWCHRLSSFLETAVKFLHADTGMTYDNNYNENKAHAAVIIIPSLFSLKKLTS